MCIDFLVVVSWFLLPDTIFVCIYSYAIEEFLSCRVTWHPQLIHANTIPTLGMSQQGQGDISTLGSAWVFFVGMPIVIEDLSQGPANPPGLRSTPP